MAVRSGSGVPFGAYRLLRRLARGGMAEVFLAVKTGPEGFERRVALKRILPHLSESAEFRTMFLDEARLAARLSHPHVVQVFDFGKVDDYSFIVMELVDGVDLGRLVEPPPGATVGGARAVPFPVAARIFADVAGGLAHAHAVGLVHRDVTPQNLLVSYDGVVKIVDFGIAKAAWKAGHTRPGVVKGKFAYLSPEQVEGRVLDGRSDVFSVGICLWETLTGDALFRRDDARAAMRQIREGDGAELAAAARRRRPDLPEELERILARALAVDADERYTASELQADLERYLKSASDLATAREVGAFVSAVAPRISVEEEEPSEDGTARVAKVPEKIADSQSDETELSGPPPNSQIHPVLSTGKTPPSVAAPSVHDAPTRFATLPPAIADATNDDATIVSLAVPGEREALAVERARATQVNLEQGAAATHEQRRAPGETVGQRRARRTAEGRPDDGPPGSVTDPVPVDELIDEAGTGTGTSAGAGSAAAALLDSNPSFSSETTLSAHDEPQPGDLTGAVTPPPVSGSNRAGSARWGEARPAPPDEGGRERPPLKDDTSASTRIHLPLDRGTDDEPSVTPPTPPSQSPPTPPRGTRASSDRGDRADDGDDFPTREHHRTAAPAPLKTREARRGGLGGEAPASRTGLLPRGPFSERTAIIALVGVTLVLVVVATVGLLRRSRARTIDDLDPVAAAPPLAPAAPIVTPAPAAVAPAPAPTPKPDGALVDVISRPDGARVLVDGEPLATTPARRLALTAGSHVISVELPSHRPRRMNIVVAAGEHRTIDVELALIHRGPKHLKHR